MATVRSRSKEHLVDLTGGRILAFGETANVDASVEHELELLEAGLIEVVDPLTPPSIPDDPDVDLFGDFSEPERGDIVYRGATRWRRRSAGAFGEVLTSGGPDADPAWSPPFNEAPPLGGRRAVLSRFDFNAHNGYGAGTIAGKTTRWDVRVMADGDDLSLAYGNFVWSGDDSRAGTTKSIFIRAALENPLTGELYPVSFGGQFEVEIGPNGYVVSDPCGYRLVKGQRVRVRTFVRTAADGDPVPDVLKYSNATSDGFQAGDHTMDAAPAFAQADAYGYAPLAAFASRFDDPSQAQILILGDSIAAGQTDGGPGSDVDRLGFALRALHNEFPYLYHAAAGAAVTSVNSLHRSGGMKFPFVSTCTHALLELGTNDGGTPQTAVEIEAGLLSIARHVRRRGVRHVWATTITPQATSTDGFTTLANQTPTTWSAGRRVAINDWMRGGSPVDPDTLAPVAVATPGALLAGQDGHPFDGFFETADAVESSRNSGKWKVLYGGGISDGTHPNGTGSDLMARAIDMRKFGAAVHTLIPDTPPEPSTLFGERLYAWLRPEDLGADTTLIANWHDASGNGRDFTQADDAHKPVVVAAMMNGFKGARFNGAVGDILSMVGGAVEIDDPFAVFIVGRWRTLGGAANKAMWNGFVIGFQLNIAPAGQIALQAGSPGAISAQPGTVTAFHQHSLVYDFEDSLLRRDGDLLVEGDPGPRHQTAGIALGGDTFGNGPADIDLLEVVFVNGRPTDAELELMELYQQNKFGTP